jgi:dTDP-4-dehydrorhamnose 3,5-epimerase
MNFNQTLIIKDTIFDGVTLFESKPNFDERGFFQRLYDINEVNFSHGQNIVQVSRALNEKKGVFRGMHFTSLSQNERKIVILLKGKIQDVLIDLRPDSQTYEKVYSFEWETDNNYILKIPPGIAHGYLTLKRKTQIMYMMSSEFDPKYYHGLKWWDNYFDFNLRDKPSIVSKQDNSWADWRSQKIDWEQECDPNIK